MLQSRRDTDQQPTRAEKFNASHPSSSHQGRLQSGAEAPDHQQTDGRNGLDRGGEYAPSITLCLVEEVESGDWGIGGKALSTADVHALARGKAA
jgi:hypothetical protein